MTTASTPVTLTLDTLTLTGGLPAGGAGSDGANSGAAVAAPELHVQGTGPVPRSIELVGARLRLPGAVSEAMPDAAPSSTAGGSTQPAERAEPRWQAVVPLLAGRWEGPAVPPPSGSYRLVIDGGEIAPAANAPSANSTSANAPSAATRSTVTTSAVTVPDPALLPGCFRYAFRVADNEVTLVLTPPLADDELGASNQARLEADYRSAAVTPLDAVFFESFYGQNASCNPLALDRELARRRPDLTRYWGVADASVVVPEGSIALVEGSAEWWRVRAGARLLIVNDWLRNRYRSRPHQKVLQTWHGTMLKKLALSRKRPGLRTVVATLRERSRWNILLAQNDFARRIFRRAYAFLGPVWEEGYPRDDVLVSGDAAEVRRRLGIAEGTTVLLYAPTWRDDRPDHVDHLDVSRFTDQLGPGFVTLIRGHSRTLQPGEDVCAGGVIDVTSYPDVSELFLAADALITDYSSVMFDFSVTGKPIYFFTPDLDRYRQVLRGFYFDLLPVAPGPVVHDADALVELVRHPTPERYAAKYAAWRERFNPRDDGKAAERVVERLEREGVI